MYFYISSLYLQYVDMYTVVMCYVGYDKFPGLVLWGMKEIVSNYQSEKLLILTYLQCLYSKMCNLAMLSYTYNVYFRYATSIHRINHHSIRRIIVYKCIRVEAKLLFSRKISCCFRKFKTRALTFAFVNNFTNFLRKKVNLSSHL